MRLLLIEDDQMLGQAVTAGLRQDGYAVDWVTDGAQASLAAQTHGYSGILLDLGLPTADGIGVLQALRAANNLTPVIVITARDTPADFVCGLDAGADDYIAKPFDLDVLSARLRAVTRRANGQTTNTIDVGPLRVEVDGRTAFWHGARLNLSAREYAVLLTLVNNRGRILSRRQLEESLYGWNDEIESNAVEVHIHHLRRKTTREFIKTVRNLGYSIG